MNAAALFMSIVNAAWQGALLCAAVWGALAVFRKLNAATRYVIWSVALLIATLLPFANYAFSVRPVTRVVHVSEVQTAATTAYAAPAPVLAPRNAALKTSAVAERRLGVAEVVSSAFAAAADKVASEAANVLLYARYLVLALLLLAVFRLVLLLREVRRMLAARTSVQFIPPPFALHDSVRRPYTFAVSNDLTTPCVLGFQPALIVLPRKLVTAAPQKELLSVILHEHEHVMRFDDVQNVLHRLAGAVAFFLPGVLIALRELAVCREQICDDAAVAGIGSRYDYARTLTAMAGWIEPSAVAAPCFIRKQKQLLKRIEVLLDAAVSHSLRPNARFALSAGAAVAAFALIVLHMQVPVFAERYDSPSSARAAAVAKPARAGSAAEAVSIALSAPAQVLQPRSAQRWAPATVKPRHALQAKRSLQAHEVLQVRDALRIRHSLQSKPVSQMQLASHTQHASRPQAFYIQRKVKSGRNGVSFSFAFKTNDETNVRKVAFGRSFATAGAWAHIEAPRAVALVSNRVTDVSSAPSAIRTPHIGGGDLLDALAQAGYHNLSVDQLIELRNHGVSPSLIAGSSAFFGRLDVSDLIHLADQGISGSYLAELREAGLGRLAAGDVIRLRDHGVSMSLIAGLRSAGYAISVGDLVKLADHGVSGSYVMSVQRIRSSGHPSIDDIIRLRDAGFFP